jgi:hypothetical protein
MKAYPVIISLTVTVLILLTIACQVPTRENQVLGEAGGVQVTVEDLLNSPAAGQITKALLSQVVILLEARERGITLDEESFQKEINDFIQMQGGREAMERMLKANNANWDDFFLSQRIQALTVKIIDQMFTEPTEEEIENTFNTDYHYRQDASRNLGIPLESVTVDQVRESIVKDLTSRERSQIQSNLYDTLFKKYNAKNFMIPPTAQEEAKTQEEKTLGQMTVGGGLETSGGGELESHSSDESKGDAQARH